MPDASSTCEVIYGFLEKDKISTAAAACIYTGIIHDTNVFKNSNTTAKTMEAAGDMMSRGIPFSRIIDDSFYRKTYVQNQILGRALLESVTFLHGKCIFSVVRRKDMIFYGVESSDLDGIVDQMRVTEGVEVRFSFTKRKIMYTKSACAPTTMWMSARLLPISAAAVM